ncbi:MAG: trans-2-enoyl-CoA reductase family protein [Candidatus Omnitrophica bacterium]|nr:trans-2-enoyl-CoA reductase family protein [Candidatus Omnitrophota bacterium]
MIVQPKIRGFICTTAHPEGCAQHVQEQIDYVRQHGVFDNGPKKVLVIGSSTGFGLASRIVAAFGCGAATIGVFFEKEADERRTATAGWYNSVGFEKKASSEGLYVKSFNGDGFSDEMRAKVVETIKKDWGAVDMVIYSMAAPRRQHPRTGKVSKSVLKPLGQEYTNKSIDLSTQELETVTLAPASDEEIAQTVDVMGGEDWEFWIDALDKEGLLSEGVVTLAYSYIGPKLTKAVYRNGTIGQAKDHLEATAKKLDARLKKSHQGHAVISVNKALVTQSSSAIPFIPLYFVLLKKVMKEKGLEEDCIAQIYRLFKTRLLAGGEFPVDEAGMIRMDDWEMREDVQSVVDEAWEKLTPQNLHELTDLKGYQEDFLRLFGFGLKDVNYDADVEHIRPLPSTV